MPDEQLESIIRIMMLMDKLGLLKEARKEFESGALTDVQMGLLISEIKKRLGK